MKPRNLLLALPSLLLSLAAMASDTHAGGHDDGAIGKPGVAAKATKTITIDMADTMRFSVPSVTAKQGETIRFVVKNSGKVKHEMVLGTEKELKEHYEIMKKNPKMVHADANMVTVAPGKTGQIIWQFTKAGKVDFACLQPGHYDAGMKGVVTVTDAKAVSKSADSAHAQTAVNPGGAPVPGNSKNEMSASAANMTQAEVRKVDMETKMITLKHGEIKNLEMPAMTMVFQVKNPAMLDKVKTGDKVRFKAEKLNGAIVVTELYPSK